MLFGITPGALFFIEERTTSARFRLACEYG